jgi:hypothetical protein
LPAAGLGHQSSLNFLNSWHYRHIPSCLAYSVKMGSG